MMNRRFFLRASAGAAIGGLTLVAAGCTDEASQGAAPDTDTTAAAQRAGLERIGVQLYTVRGLMEQDFEGTLEQVAGIGYDDVEFAGYFGRTPEQVRALLDRLGLAAPSAHVGYDLLRDDLDAQIAAAKVIGHRYLVCPYLTEAQRTSLDVYRQHAALFNEVGKRLRDEGLRFAYHNHDFEFQSFDGTRAFDLLLEETDPELVDIELDLYWTVKAGQDPLAYFERYPGRFKLFHVKDMADRAGTQRMAAVGEGELDFATILAQARAQGGEHFIVEHDNPEDPIDSIRKSHAHLAQLEI